MAGKFVISTPVADLLRKPQEELPKDFSHQALRDSQLLFGEKIAIRAARGEWFFIEALEQMRFTEEDGWHPYRGWVRRSEVQEVEEYPLINQVVIAPSATLYPQGIDLAFGTYLTGDSEGNIILPGGEKSVCNPSALRPLPKQFDRAQLVKDAYTFLDAPYLWGGRSGFLKKAIASVDCSGLVNLLYRAQGLLIPRDAHDQHLKAKAVNELKPGDLVYLKKEARVSHVIVFLGGDLFIEAPETGKNVRLLKWTETLDSYTSYSQTFEKV